MNKHIKHIIPFPEQVICTAADNDTGTLLGKFPDQGKLNLCNLRIGGERRFRRCVIVCGLCLRVFEPGGKNLISGLDRFLTEAAFLGGFSNQKLVHIVLSVNYFASIAWQAVMAIIL